MNRSLLRILLLLLILGALTWFWVGRVRQEPLSDSLSPNSESNERPLTGEAVQAAPPDGESSIGFTVVSSRPAPRPGVPPSAERMEDARVHLDGGGQQGSCGPYALLGDMTDPDLLQSCELLATALDATYTERLGAAPLGEPAAIIFLFSRRGSYNEFAALHGMKTAGYAAHSQPSPGFTAIWADTSRPDDFAKTLVHELTHLVNRRALGGNLPRWLSEGLADALGDTATPAGIQPLQGFVGVEGQAKRLRLGYETGGVQGVDRLVALGPEEFDSSPNSYDYEQSTLLVRFLLLDPELGPRFRIFLAELADGSPCTPDILQQHLDLDWSELDSRLQEWLGVEPASTTVLSSGDSTKQL